MIRRLKRNEMEYEFLRILYSISRCAVRCECSLIQSRWTEREKQLSLKEKKKGKRDLTPI